MAGLHFRLRYSLRLLLRSEWDEVHTNVDIHTLMRESSIRRQDIRDILISFDSGLIYWYVSTSLETRWEQVESMEDETNVPFTLSFSSCPVLSQRECKPGIKLYLLNFSMSNQGGILKVSSFMGTSWASVSILSKITGAGSVSLSTPTTTATVKLNNMLRKI